MSEIILWRHAEAFEPEEGQDDLDRRLTHKGQRQAERVGQWLDRNLPEQCRVFVSPAKRCLQTARHLPRRHKVLDELAPDARPETVLAAVGWGAHSEPVIVIGHQPWIGECVHWLLWDAVAPLTVRKGAAWWLQTRSKATQRPDIVIRAVTTPELL